ncbi:hypothetical protein [Paractinoplanes atraurantiacus]|uniref:Uncharacterized protein n=1 Tax=Paractinoplanes atraurantiacus TaxID=1036182 RepID=A0A285IL84_9ACTN|nr:hypothetical protein [Actinoplanes atraurantiacus]SNY48704.1 hypothetical protein SAMN05421748_10986 [Actinoplanes atraurantiacus]
MSLDTVADLAQVAHVTAEILLVLGPAAIGRFFQIRRRGRHSASAYRGRHLGLHIRSNYGGRHRGTWYIGGRRSPGYAARHRNARR